MAYSAPELGTSHTNLLYENLVSAKSIIETDEDFLSDEANPDAFVDLCLNFEMISLLLVDELLPLMRFPPVLHLATGTISADQNHLRKVFGLGSSTILVFRIGNKTRLDSNPYSAACNIST